MFILTSLFFYCSTAKADDCDSNVIELYDYETGQTSNISISDYSINFLPASGIIFDTPIPTKNYWHRQSMAGSKRRVSIYVYYVFSNII